MDTTTSETIVVRSRNQPYIVFTVLLVPIIALDSYAALHSGVTSNVGLPAVMLCILLSIYYYLGSIKLILTSDRIIIKKMWHSQSIRVESVRAVEKSRGPFGIGGAWLIRAKDGTDLILVNINNFDANALRKFAEGWPKNQASFFRRSGFSPRTRTYLRYAFAVGNRRAA